MRTLNVRWLSVAFVCTAAAVVLATPVAAFAQAEADKRITLKPGDPAPPLAVSKWVKGEPVKELEKGKVYLLEFWATWCGPCIAAMPHVSELQQKYKDKGLVVIATNVWENDADAVGPFVKEMGEKMDLRVATDDTSHGEGKMAETWMKAAGRDAIPTSFIVDRKGQVAWIGGPMDLDGPLAAVLDGTFDPKKAAEQQAKLDVVQKKLDEALQAGKHDDALAAVDEILAIDSTRAPRYAPVKVFVFIQKKDYKKANALAKELSEGELGKNQQALIRIAYALLGEGGTDKGIDYDVALAVAEKAVGLGGVVGKSAKTLVAKAHAAKGDYEKAVVAQTEAMEDADTQQKIIMQRDLDSYKSKAEKKG